MPAPEDKNKSTSKSQAWFCTTGLPSDVIVNVGYATFHLHKFPLMSRSRKLQQLIAEQEKIELRRNGDDQMQELEIDDAERLRISLPELPGGPEAFEMAAKFCYGVKIEFTASNAVPLRCAAERLEMTEEISQDNLVAVSERFITESIYRGVQDSVRALKSCNDELIPVAEALGIVQRCVDAIAANAASADPTSLFGWPISENVVDWRASDRFSWVGIDAKLQLRHKGCVNLMGQVSSDSVPKPLPPDSWIEELTTLSFPMYKRVISAMKAQDLCSEIVEGSLIAYAKNSIPGLLTSGRKSTSVDIPSESEQIELLEIMIVNLPPQRSADPASTKILFGMLRIVNILRASNALREALEKKIGTQLEQAGVEELLMPSYTYLAETLYDVDCVGMRSNATEEVTNEVAATAMWRSPQTISPLMVVGRLVDRYLSEIASDVNLKPEKFCSIAFALPEQARVYDDGIYRAIDIYLKTHQQLAESEREKLCGVMDYQKLTLEACTHAAQNERLPLRSIVQVLFFEQLQLRHAIAGSLTVADGANQQPISARNVWNEAITHGDGGTNRRVAPDNQMLGQDMDRMRRRIHELEKECFTIRMAIDKIDKTAVAAMKRGSVSKMFGCKFRTQVCDSHERTIVQSQGRRAESIDRKENSV